MKNLVLKSEEDFLIIDKPAGILSQKDKSGEDDIAAVLKKNLGLNGFLAPVHRLDRNTSGLLVLAKSANAARMLTDSIQNGGWEKKYLAIVKGDPGESGRFDFPLKKDENKNQSFVAKGGAPATTEFIRKKKMGSSSLMEVTLHTGRSHQIRAHFSAAGHYLIGDRKYGKKPWSEIFHRPALHASALTIHLPNRTIHMDCSLPTDMIELLRKLGG